MYRSEERDVEEVRTCVQYNTSAQEEIQPNETKPAACGIPPDAVEAVSSAAWLSGAMP